MIKVKQRDGNDCLAACIASVLEVDIETLPRAKPEHFNGNWTGYISEIADWLTARNLGLVCKEFTDWLPTGYCLVGVKRSSESNLLHSMVAFNGEIIWDPQYGEDIWWYSVEDFLVFSVLDPHEPIRLDPVSR